MTQPAAVALPPGMPQRFAAKPYKPDGGVSPAGVGMLVSALVLIGAAIGFVMHWVAKAFYFVVLFPILIGIALGWIGKIMVRKGRVRNPWIGALAGFLGGLLAMTMMHYFDYEEFRRTAKADQEFMSLAAMPREDRDRAWAAEKAALDAKKPSFNVPTPINVVTVEERQQDSERAIAALDSFPAYMHLSATEGVTISRSRSSSSEKPLNLGYVGSWIYWIIEVLIVAGITLFMVKGETAKPFCRECGDWKPERWLGGFTGDREIAKAGVLDGDMTKLAAAGPIDRSVVMPLQLHAAVCANCSGTQSPADLRLVEIETNPQGKVTDHTRAHATWPSESVAALEAFFAAYPPPPPADPNAVPAAATPPAGDQNKTA